MSRNSNIEKFRRPELFLADLIKRSAKEEFLLDSESVPFLYRAVVVAVDNVGGVLENPDASGGFEALIDGKTISMNATSGPINPANSIKARIMTDGFDQFRDDESLRTFWPFFQDHSYNPIKPGEYVYVVFEDRQFEHGLWLTKLSGHENLNFFKGENSLKSSTKTNNLSKKFKDTNNLQSNNDISYTSDRSAGEFIPSKRLSKLFK